MGIHVGVNGTPKEVVGVYVGVNGTPKECSDVYVGVNGTPKSCYSGVKPGETIFTSSSTFTVPKGVKKIDVFCVGGGGAVLGSQDTGGPSTACGGTSSVGSICRAAGGYSGCSFSIINPEYRPFTTDISRYIETCKGGNGGSGGGGGEIYLTAFTYVCITTAGGVDGGNGESYNTPFTFGDIDTVLEGGKGQGTTTRYFGESTGTLYSSGGRSFRSNSNGNSLANASANTGNGASPLYELWHNGGGGGGYTKTVLGVDVTPGQQIAVTVGGGMRGWDFGGAGGSGICIIRWDDQK